MLSLARRANDRHSSEHGARQLVNFAVRGAENTNGAADRGFARRVHRVLGRRGVDPLNRRAPADASK